MNKCKQCNAVVNPKWKKCLVCGLPLKVNKPNVLPTISEKIKNMTLREFAERNLAIKVYSEVLGKDIWLVSDEEMEKELNDGLVAYLPPEIKHLVKLKATPGELIKIHMIKETFPGSKIVWN